METNDNFMTAITEHARKQKRKRMIIGAVVGFFVVVGIVGSFVDDKKVDGKSDSNKDRSEMAFVIAQGFVQNTLVSPSTADFPLLDYKHRTYANQVYEISSYVDSQNKLGATVRTRWAVKLQYIGGTEASPDSWKLIDITEL